MNQPKSNTSINIDSEQTISQLLDSMRLKAIVLNCGTLHFTDMIYGLIWKLSVCCCVFLQSTCWHDSVEPWRTRSCCSMLTSSSSDTSCFSHSAVPSLRYCGCVTNKHGVLDRRDFPQKENHAEVETWRPVFTVNTFLAFVMEVVLFCKVYYVSEDEDRSVFDTKTMRSVHVASWCLWAYFEHLMHGL